MYIVSFFEVVLLYKLCVSFLYRDDVSDDTTHSELTL